MDWLEEALGQEEEILRQEEEERKAKDEKAQLEWVKEQQQALSLAEDQQDNPRATPEDLSNMEGVYEYPPSHVMTAEELARVRNAKRNTREWMDRKPAAKLGLKSPPQATPAVVMESVASVSAVETKSVPAVATSSLQEALEATPNFNESYDGQLRVEQDDDLLMDGQREVWEGGNDGDNDSIVSIFSNDSL